MSAQEEHNEHQLTTYDIFRETSEGASKLSRLCIDLKNKNVAYYCEVTADHVAIHRGDSNGPVIATAASFEGKDGITDIEMTELGATVPIRHKHHTLPMTHGSTYFRADGKQYRWKKHEQLVDEDTGTVLAVFYPARGSPHLGSLHITPAGEKLRDLAVITALVDQERSDEKKWKVKGFRSRH